MFEIICWVLIGILAFYMIRNIIAGSVLYPMAAMVVEKWNATAHRSWRLRGGFRNYYLFVLNPLWWTPQSTMKDKKERKTVKTALNSTMKLLKTTLRLQKDMQRMEKNLVRIK